MIRRLFALTLLLGLCLVGCAQTVQTTPSPQASVSPSAAPEKLPFALAYFPEASLHPITGNSHTNQTVGTLVYQGLFELDNTFTPQGVLCASWTVSEDGLTWTFTLADATFSDGTPVTAEAVVSSLELARSSQLYSGRLADVQSVSAGEDGSVSITLSQPNGLLPTLLDIPILLDEGDGSMPLGTGPYAYVEDGSPLHLARQASAPNSAPAEISLVPIQGPDELIYAFDAGDVSLVVSDLTGSTALGYSSGYEVFDYPTTTLLYVGFQIKSGPCRDAAVRQAISRSFDRDTVASSLLAGHAVATCLPFSPCSALYSAAHEEMGGYNPSAASEGLAQAGLLTGEDGLLYNGRTALELTFVVNTDNSFKLNIAEYLAGQLTELGFSVDLQKLAWDDYTAALEKGDFDLYLGEVTLTADFDLRPLLGQGGTLNYGGYASAQANSLLTQLRSAEEEQARTQAVGAFLDLFQIDMPLTPLCFKTNSVLTQWGAVSGLEPTRQNPFYHLENLRFSS